MEYMVLHGISQEHFHKKLNLGMVLEDINFFARRNETIGIIARKPTERAALVQILSGFCAPKTGSYFLDSEPLPYDSDRLLAAFRNYNIGCISESYPLLEKWDVADNISLPLTYSCKCAPSKIQSECMKALAFAELQGFSNREVWTMTEGEKVRVKIARAFVNHPKVIVGENLLEGLNLYQAKKVMECIEQFPSNGVTTILFMEDEEIAKCCDRMYILKDGKLAEI